MDLSDLQTLLATVRGVRVACVGDLMVDRFVYGDVSRISPEAPIPVLAHRREQSMLGAAGNVARNVAALGGAAALAGVIGRDGPANEAVTMIGAEHGVEGCLVVAPDRITTVKTRFVANGQQLLRHDVEELSPLAPRIAERMVAAVEDAVHGAGAILLSDYGKGAVTDGVIQACLAAARKNDTILIVDSKARSFLRYGPVDIAKPNAAELAFATDMPTSTDDEIAAALHRALELCEARAVLVTRAAKGISLLARGGSVRHFPVDAREVFDASGAGDTTLAALGLALAAQAPIKTAIAFALLASSVAVGKMGTATVSPEELMEASLSAHLAPAEAKIATAQHMVEEVAKWRSKGLKVGFTNGCFDIIHRGHVAYLAQARAWCDRLVVGLNSDRSVRALKGEGRPVNDLESRAMVLAGLGSVDLVVPFDTPTPIELIEAARPDVLVKGADYTEDGVVGHDRVKSWGGQVRLAPLVEGYSTTAAIARMAVKGDTGA